MLFPRVPRSRWAQASLSLVAASARSNVTAGPRAGVRWGGAGPQHYPPTRASRECRGDRAPWLRRGGPPKVGSLRSSGICGRPSSSLPPDPSPRLVSLKLQFPVPSLFWALSDSFSLLFLTSLWLSSLRHPPPRLPPSRILASLDQGPRHPSSPQIAS